MTGVGSEEDGGENEEEDDEEEDDDDEEEDEEEDGGRDGGEEVDVLAGAAATTLTVTTHLSTLRGLGLTPSPRPPAPWHGQERQSPGRRRGEEMRVQSGGRVTLFLLG